MYFLKALGFNPNITGGTAPTVHSIALQKNGKVIVGGNFTSVGGQTRNRVARLNDTGSLDTTFNQMQGPNAVVRSVAVDGSGNVLIGGDFTTVNSDARNRVARFFAGGALDGVFQYNVAGANAPVYAIAPQPDGRVTIAGEFTAMNGATRNRVGRLNENGTLDDTFRPSPTTLLSQNGANDVVRALAVQWDGLFVIGGDFTAYTVPGNSQALSAGPRVARIGGH